MSYTYDLQDQLTKETYYFYENGSLMYTDTEQITYNYDTAGNILTLSGGGNTVSYAYTDTNWPDLLTQITVNGTSRTISYNSGSGNPTTWYNGTDYSDFRWEQGNRLAQVCSNGGYKYYRYDMSGVRTEKTVGGVTHSYVTQNGKVVRESYGSKVLDFIYDAAGRPFALRYSSNGGSSFVTYYYRLNLQGDVIALVNTDGSTEAIYEYDAWGYPVYTSATTMSSINPLRYRGYYYDTETGWYYLQSRYYDPAVRRFINADSYAGTGQSFLGYNMFAYCENSPVLLEDASGSYPVNLFEEEVGHAEFVYSNHVTHGAGQPKEDLTNNCYSYAFGLPGACNPGFYAAASNYPYYFDPTSWWIHQRYRYMLDPCFNEIRIKSLVMKDMAALGRNCRIIDNPNDSNPGESVVALKTGRYIFQYGYCDYHFAVLSENGIWTDKPGASPVRSGAISGYDEAWPLLGVSNSYYDSPTIFFAVGGEVR